MGDKHTDVKDAFQQMGEKLGWFQHKNLDSAINSLTTSSNKKSKLSLKKRTGTNRSASKSVAGRTSSGKQTEPPDVKPNSKVHSAKIAERPIYNSSFVPDGEINEESCRNVPVKRVPGKTNLAQLFRRDDSDDDIHSNASSSSAGSKGGKYRPARLVLSSSDSDSDQDQEENFVSCIAESFVSSAGSDMYDDSVVNIPRSVLSFSPELDKLGEPLVESTRIHRRSSVTYQRIMNSLEDSDKIIGDCQKVAAQPDLTSGSKAEVGSMFSEVQGVKTTDTTASIRKSDGLGKQKLFSVCEELDNLSVIDDSPGPCNTQDYPVCSQSLDLHLSLTQGSTASQQDPSRQTAQLTDNTKEEMLVQTVHSTDNSIEDQTFTTCKTNITSPNVRKTQKDSTILDTKSNSTSQCCLSEAETCISSIGESLMQVECDTDRVTLPVVGESAEQTAGFSVCSGEDFSNCMSTIGSLQGDNSDTSADRTSSLSEEGDSYQVVDVSIQTSPVTEIQRLTETMDQLSGADEQEDASGLVMDQMSEKMTENLDQLTEEVGLEEADSLVMDQTSSEEADGLVTDQTSSEGNADMNQDYDVLDEVVSVQQSVSGSSSSSSCQEEGSMFEVADMAVQTDPGLCWDCKSPIVSPFGLTPGKIIKSEQLSCKYSPRVRAVDNIVKSPSAEGKQLFSQIEHNSGNRKIRRFLSEDNLISPESGKMNNNSVKPVGDKSLGNMDISVDRQTDESSLFSNVSCNLGNQYDDSNQSKEIDVLTESETSPHSDSTTDEESGTSLGSSHGNSSLSNAAEDSQDSEPETSVGNDMESEDEEINSKLSVTSSTDSNEESAGENKPCKPKLPESAPSVHNDTVYHDALDFSDIADTGKQHRDYDTQADSYQCPETSWRQGTKCRSDSSSEDDFESYLEKLKKPAKTEQLEVPSSSEDDRSSMRDFVVEDDEMSSESDDSESDDSDFYIRDDLESTPASTLPKSTKSTLDCSDDEDFSQSTYPRSVTKHKKQLKSGHKCDSRLLSSSSEEDTENIPPKQTDAREKKTSRIKKTRRVPGKLNLDDKNDSDEKSSTLPVTTKKQITTAKQKPKSKVVSGQKRVPASVKQSKLDLSSDSDDGDMTTESLPRPVLSIKSTTSSNRSVDEPLFKQPTPLVRGGKKFHPPKATPSVRSTGSDYTPRVTPNVQRGKMNLLHPPTLTPTTTPTPTHKPPVVLGFISSLSTNIDGNRRHPDAERYITNFKKTKDDLPLRLFHHFNTTVFDSKLPTDLPVQWNKRLLRTAGYCKIKLKRTKSKSGEVEERTASVDLSTKVCDSAERVRDTLIHELCHAAVWLLNKEREAHGPYWKHWAQKANHAHPELPVIARCHNYSINTKYTYRCRNCGYSFGRHSKSLDTEAKVCGKCRGTFEVLLTGSKNSSDATATPKTPRRPNRFALYVKEHYSVVKQKEKGLKHGDVMKQLSKMFSEMNSIS